MSLAAAKMVVHCGHVGADGSGDIAHGDGVEAFLHYQAFSSIQ